VVVVVVVEPAAVLAAAHEERDASREDQGNELRERTEGEHGLYPETSA
jgi:hypothetical protein